MDFKTSEIIKLDFKTYGQYFENSDFGLNLSKDILKSKNIFVEPERIAEGSSLVFKISDDLILKITPPFFNDSFDTELKVTNAVAKNFNYQIPEIIESGQLENWRFLISKRVSGQQIYKVFRNFSFEDKKNLATDLGNMIYELRQLKGISFKRDFDDWNSFLINRLENQYDIHLQKGNSEEWSKKIADFVQKQSNNLLSLKSEFLVHADINYQHVMVAQINDKWKVTGIIDFADSMIAPSEVEFILPFLDFFRGSFELQNELIVSSQYNKKLSDKDFSYLMMALTLQNRFIAFYDWFDREIKNGINSIEELAEKVYPYKN